MVSRAVNITFSTGSVNSDHSKPTSGDLKEILSSCQKISLLPLKSVKVTISGSDCESYLS